MHVYIDTALLLKAFKETGLLTPANMIRGTSNPRSVYNAKDKHTQ